MSYLVFARKFRPQTFDEIVGQEAIATTLKNAISKGRVAQSFLFTGSRGVGKTSTARILAKALNCEKGPTATPCNKCPSCEEVTNGSSLDVLEIDGASNRGIEEIRGLRENVKFKPATGRFKVYIIDEVHMLTGEAFNALLKTLEEPPGHVKFIFATTEAHKVPLTILSRCQRFNFRRIPTQDIVKKLKEIAKKEKIKATDEALFLMAKSAEGSLRDGESLLDQLASFCAGEIKEEDVIFSLGLTSDKIYFPLAKTLHDRNSEKTLRMVGEMIDAGNDLIQFSRGLLELFRDLMMFEIGGDAEKLVEASEDRQAALKKLKGSFSHEELFLILALLQQLVRDVRWSQVPRFLVETCFLKITNRAKLLSVTEAIENVKSKKSGGEPTTRPEAQVRKKDKPDFATGNSSREKTPPPASFSPTRTNETNIESDSEQAVTTQTMVADKEALSVTLSDLERIWPELLEGVRKVKMSCGTYLAEAEPVDVTDGYAVFGFPAEFKFHKESLESKENKELIRSKLVELLNCQIGVSFVVTEPEQAVTPKKEKPAASAPDNSEIIMAALNVFEGSKVIYRES